MTLESLKWIDKHLIFRETFNSEADTIKNVWPITWTGVTFSDGRIYKTSNTSWINMNQINMPDKWSIRFIFSTSTVATYRCLIGNVNVSAPTATRLQHNASGGLDMRNNVNASAKTANGVIDANTEYDVIVTNDGTATGNITFYINWVKSGSSKTLADSFQFTRLLWAGAGYGFTGNCNLAELYSRALSAEEVSALYDNSLYREPPVQTPDGKEVLSIDPSIWSVVDKFWTPLNTNVETIKDESYMMDFNGSNTKLYYGSSPIWSNPPQLSIAIWVQSNIKPVGTDDYYLGFPKDESGWQTGLIFYCDTSWNLKIAYNWTSSKYIGTTTSYVWKTTCVWFTYDVVGWGKIYIDWELIDSDIAVGALNLTEDELTVGNFWTTYSRFFDWLIGKIRMNTAIRTAEDHARFYNATKHLYNK